MFNPTFWLTEAPQREIRRKGGHLMPNLNIITKEKEKHEHYILMTSQKHRLIINKCNYNIAYCYIKDGRPLTDVHNIYI